MTTDTTPPGRAGRRTIGRVRDASTPGPRGGVGAAVQARWSGVGTGQAVALNEAAESATRKARAANAKAGKVPRADLLRTAIRDGLALSPEELAALPEVEPAGPEYPKGERSISWVPEPGMLYRIDTAAEAAGISRNDAIRRYVARWLRQQS